MKEVQDDKITTMQTFSEEEKEEEQEEVVVEFDLEALQDADQQRTTVGGGGDPTPLQLRKNRAIMTVLHFCLTYPRWSISLFLLFANLTTPLPTAYERVRRPVQNLQAVVAREAQLYHECVYSGFQMQDIQMDRAADIEQERVDQLVVVAQQIILQAADLTQRCSDSTLAGQRGMQGWDAMGLIVPKTFNSTADTSICSADDQERLYGLLTEDLTAIQNNVTGILDAFITQSLASLHKVLKYSQDRGAYDYDYFIGIKIQATLDALDILSAPNITLSFPEQQIVLELRIILQGLIDALNGAYIQIDGFSVRIGEFHASISAFYVNYIELYTRLGKISNFMRDFLPELVDLPNFFNITGIPMANVLLPPVFAIPDFPALPNIEDMVSEYIIKAIKLISRLLLEAAEEASEQTRKIIEEIIEMLKELLTLEDYDPPKYPRDHEIESPEDEVAYVNDLAEKTKSDAADALDDIKKQRDTVPDYEPDAPDLDEVEPPDLGEEDPTQFSFLDLGIPEIVVPVWILTVVGYICTRSFLIECLTQAVRLYRLKRKYEQNGAPDLPEIDYIAGTEQNDEKEEEKQSKPSTLEIAQRMMLKHLFNPWVICGLMFIPFVLLILFFWFPHVKATCVDSRRGTFLARNVFKQIHVNKANAKGYTLHTVAQLKCNRRQRSICNRKSAESNVIHRKNAAALHSLQRRFNDSIEIRGILDRCVDISELDEQFESNCCGLEGYTSLECSLEQQPQFCPIDMSLSPPESYRPVGASLLEPACHSNVSTLRIESSLFNCSVLEETCDDVPCNGVDADLIEEMTIEADCSAEIYAIQVCIFLALTVYHAIMINICNALLFNGMLHLRWRSLNPEGIKLVTHVNANGELVKGGDIHERTDRIEKAMQRFRLSGWIQIGLSLVVFVFWMVTFAVLRMASSRIDMYHE